LEQTKPFNISKQSVLEAFKKVKANKGGAGVDRQTIEEFERNLKDNLYKIWNRLSSGSYMPPAVLRVEIPKSDGKIRPLGIPTVADRVAQMVIKQQLEPKLEKVFHQDSYGYRPNKSAIDALKQARTRCWRNDWVLDLDIKGFFDNINHELMMKAVEKHTQDKWVLLYIKRWLEEPVAMPDGTLVTSQKGTPQGGVISPLLANLFLHYAFDKWMERNFPNISFERYADDSVCHCKSEAQAKMLKNALEQRMKEVGLELHPEKTKIVYCKDADRTQTYPNIQFDFLGFTFRPRKSKNKYGKYFINFSPAISNKAIKRITSVMREWKVQNRSDKSLEDLAYMFHRQIQGWINYYSHFYKSALHPLFQHLDERLSWWATRKFKKLRGHKTRAREWLRTIAQREPKLFPHWRLLCASYLVKQ
jgi:RNA-directed DNA polymerase